MKLITWNSTARPISIFNDFDNFLNDFSTSLNYSSSWEPKFEVLNTDQKLWLFKYTSIHILVDLV